MIRKLLCWLGWHEPEAQLVEKKSVLFLVNRIVIISGGWGCLYCEAGGTVTKEIQL